MRVRFRFTKLGKIRFTSHRDVARLWERALRRSGLPVARTEGFNPRPKVHFGLALSTGYESLGEYLDVDMVSEVPVEPLAEQLSPLLPAGIDVTAAAAVQRGTSLQQAVTSCEWTVEVPGVDPSSLSAAVARALASQELPVTRERKGKKVSDDLRPMIRSLEVAGPLPPEREQMGSVLGTELSTQPRGVKPAELLDVLLTGHEPGRVWRTHQWIELDRARQEPLLPEATRAQHAEARAS